MSFLYRMAKMKQEERQLAELRNRIDELDEQIVKLLNARAQIVLDIKELKRKKGLPIHDGQREEEVFEKIGKISDGPLDEKTLRQIYQKIIEHLKAFE